MGHYGVAISYEDVSEYAYQVDVVDEFEFRKSHPDAKALLPIPSSLKFFAEPLKVSFYHMASDEDLKAEIERLRAENEALKKPTRGQMSLKVSEKLRRIDGSLHERDEIVQKFLHAPLSTRRVAVDTGEVLMTGMRSTYNIGNRFRSCDNGSGTPPANTCPLFLKGLVPTC